MGNHFFNSKTAKGYDSRLNFPIVRTIRRQEKLVLDKIFDQYVSKDDNVLEVGAGTGYYTIHLAARAKSLITLEPASAMADILKEKIDAKKISNIKILSTSFLDFTPENKFDHVVIIGVLDYVKDWQKFLEHSLKLTNKTIIFTAPQQGFLTSFRGLISLLNGIKIYEYTTAQLQNYFENYQMKIKQAGLRSFLTKGLTIVAVVQKMT